jgi:hypothetical protein
MPNAPAIGWRNGFRSPARKVIDRSHPMTASLKAFHVPVGLGVCKDLCGQLDLLPYSIGVNGTMPSNDTTTWGGLSMTSGGAGCQGSVAKTGSSGPLSLQPPVTFMWVGRFNGEPDAGQMFYGCDYEGYTGPPISYGILKEGFAGWMSLKCRSSGTDVAATSFGISPDYTNPIPRVLIGTISSAGLALWMNGTRIATDGTSITVLDYSAGFSATDGSHMCVGTRNGESGKTSNATFAAGAVWNRALTDAEIIRLSADPFLFLKA